MLLKCATALLALLFCLPGCGMAEEEPFRFDEGLTWASTPEEAVAWLGEGAEFQENTDEDLGKLGLVTKDDLEYAGLPCGRAAIIYYNDAMVYATFYYDADSAGADLEKLIRAVREKLGEPEYLKTTQDAEMPEAFESMRVRCQWSPDKDTHVSVLEITEADYPYLCGLFFENLPVEEQLKIAMEVE